LSKHEKFRARLMSGQADANIGFSEMVNFLLHLGFRLTI
jgi:hypothetical protein